MNSDKVTLSKTSYKSTLTTPSLLTNQLFTLYSRKNDIIIELDRFLIYSSSSNQCQIDLNQQIHKIQSIQIEIDDSINLLQQVQSKLHLNSQQQLSFIAEIQEKEQHLDSLSKKLIQFFKSTLNEIDHIRLQMMTLQDHKVFKQLNHTFSFRKAIIMFLRDKLLIKHRYPFGLQLQISVQKKAYQFLCFMLSLLGNEPTQHLPQLLQIINHYAALLKQAQSLIERSLNSPDSHNISLFQNDNQKCYRLIEAANLLKIDLAQLQTKLKQSRLSGCYFSRRISQLSTIIKQKREEHKQCILHTQMLRQKLRCLRANNLFRNQLNQQLMQVTQAIQYLQSRNNSINTNIQLKGSTSLTIPQSMTSPSSTTSLPHLTSSNNKKQLIRSSIRNYQPSPKKLFLNQSKIGKRLSSPSSWK